MTTDFELLMEILERAGYPVRADSERHSFTIHDDLDNKIAFFFTPVGDLIAVATEGK